MELRKLGLRDILWPWCRIRELYYALRVAEHQLHIAQRDNKRLVEGIDKMYEEMKK